MGTKDIEKLLTDLKNLPKQNAPEDFEQKLLMRINLYESQKSSGEFSFRRFVINYFNPIYVPAFTIVLAAVLIIYALDKNQIKVNSIETRIEKAIPVVQDEQSISKSEPQKISVPKKRDYVVRRDRIKLNLGPGVNLDEKINYEDIEPTTPSLISFPFTDEPVTIRIPPPEEIFKNELERLNNFKNLRDSIRLINSRRR